MTLTPIPFTLTALMTDEDLDQLEAVRRAGDPDVMKLWIRLFELEHHGEEDDG